MSALSGRGVGVRFGPVQVLDGVDVDVRRGEVLALVGPNGAGKSTLLAVLAGDLTPTTGTVEIDGVPLASRRLRDLARQRAVLTQENRISFPFPVLDVVRMGRAPWRGLPEEDLDDVVVADALHVTATSALADRPFGLLSGGEKGRVSFARVLAQQTPVVLLDEPTAALDLGHQEAVLGRARALADEGSAVVVVLHDLSLAAAWSDRVVLLEAGRVAAEGRPDQVFTADLLSRVYDHPVAVLAHPVTGELLVLADRARRPLTNPLTSPLTSPVTQEASP